MSAERLKDGSTRLDWVGAWLDRDVVVVLTPSEPLPALLIRGDDVLNKSVPIVMMAALPLPEAAPRDAIGLKLLVDCSGSMGGDSIASARLALHGVVDALRPKDRVSLTRFGSRVEPCLPATTAHSRALRRVKAQINTLETDLGGTDMEAGLDAVFELTLGGAGEADVLLITDGEIWQAASMIEKARRSGHRVFAIGVGSAPPESVLRTLAEATGGACEFATPGEDLEDAARRMLTRIRQSPWRGARIDWGREPAWRVDPPPNLFGGDTAVALAGFDRPAGRGKIRLLAEDWAGELIELARAEAEAPCDGDGLARIAAARRIARSSDAQALAVALHYQLMGLHTNCVLVHERADAERATNPTRLQRVGHMLAAGWGATGSVRPLEQCFYAPSRQMVSSPLRSFPAAIEPPVLRKPRQEARPPASLRELACSIGAFLLRGGSVEALADHVFSLELHVDVLRTILDLADVGLDRGEICLLLAEWINSRNDGLGNDALASALNAAGRSVDAPKLRIARRMFKARLGHQPLSAWRPSRFERLQRALGDMARRDGREG